MKNNIRFHVILVLVLGLVPVNANAASVSGQGTWETTLQGRDLDGNLTTAEAYYDTDLNITWLANANYAVNLMDWSSANAWAAGLNPYGSGITGWRLPYTGPVNGATYNYAWAYDGSADQGYNIGAPGTVYAGSTGSEMAHMFYITLGNLAYCDTSANCPQAGWGATNTGPFSNVPGEYWSATALEAEGAYDYAWLFSFNYGSQYGTIKADSYGAWAVHSGDVGTAIVPVPATVWLFGSGLIGLLGVSRKRRH